MRWHPPAGSSGQLPSWKLILGVWTDRISFHRFIPFHSALPESEKKQPLKSSIIPQYPQSSNCALCKSADLDWFPLPHLFLPIFRRLSPVRIRCFLAFLNCKLKAMTFIRRSIVIVIFVSITIVIVHHFAISPSCSIHRSAIFSKSTHFHPLL